MSDEEGGDMAPLFRGLYNTSSPRMLPCPFCGCTDVSLASVLDPDMKDSIFWVRCPCGVEGPDGYSERDAVERWNRRTGQ